MKQVSKRWLILASICAFVLILDQWTKFLAVKHLTPALASTSGGFFSEIREFYSSVEHPCRGRQNTCQVVEVIDGFWNWRYVENPGAAWGILANASDSVRVPFFFVTSIGAIIFIFVFFRKLEERQKFLIFGFSFVLGGALGNFVDRLHMSYVIDFIDWYVSTYHWPTFNIADAAISTGVGLLMLDWIREPSQKKLAEAAATDKAT